MLVLARKENGRIYINTPCGDRITLVVARLGAKKVRLGIVAPPDYTVLRDDAKATSKRTDSGGDE